MMSDSGGGNSSDRGGSADNLGPLSQTQSQSTQSASSSQGTQNPNPNSTQNTVPQSTQNSQKDKSQGEKKWKLKNAELKVIDIYCKPVSSASMSSPVIKLEIKLTNRAAGDITRIVGE